MLSIVLLCFLDNMILCNAGNKYAQVLPDPVLAIDMTSFDCNNIGHDCDCVGVGEVKPSFVKTLFISEENGVASKLVIGAKISSLVFPIILIFIKSNDNNDTTKN